MRIVIDMQSIQSESKYRGIGRYAIELLKALITNKKNDTDIIVVFNGSMPIDASHRSLLEKKIGKENIKIFSTFGETEFQNLEYRSEREISKKIREYYIQSLEPDFILLTSLFEGYADNAITSVHQYNKIPTAVILYDLIPLIFADKYLVDPVYSDFYKEKLDYLKQANILFSISNSAGADAVTHVGFNPETIVNIGTGRDNFFRKVTFSDTEKKQYTQKFNIKSKKFIMYTGSFDYRKNCESLIEAYALLPNIIREEYALVIVGKIHDHQMMVLQNLFASKTTSGELVFTNYTTDEDLLALYNLCSMFVFPSMYEGFGLPLLEAMQCGKAVIAANISSMPEVIGDSRALFEVNNTIAFAKKIEEVLTDLDLRNELELYAEKQVLEFDWSLTANKILDTFESRASKAYLDTVESNRLSLAVVSPFPPAKSGISTYIVDLLKELSKYYNIIAVSAATIEDAWVCENCVCVGVTEFKDNYLQYDRVLYQFGNSEYHSYMFELLYLYPGVVDLHDFFLSNILLHDEITQKSPMVFQKELYNSHGYSALSLFNSNGDNSHIARLYPCSWGVVRNSFGVICHNRYSKSLAKEWYGDLVDDSFSMIPLLKPLVQRSCDKLSAKKLLGYEDTSYLICVFGIVDKTKLSQEVILAFQDWMSSRSLEHVHLVFVGELYDVAYKELIVSVLDKNIGNKHVKITGWVNDEEYAQYLSAADMAIQLRSASRGESSAAVLDCMTYAIPTIVNANGSMAEFPNGCVQLLADSFNHEELKLAIDYFYLNPLEAKVFGENARKYIEENHNSEKCAIEYNLVIEKYYKRQYGFQLTKNIATSEKTFTDNHLLKASRYISDNFFSRIGRPTVFIDISMLVKHDLHTGIERVVKNILKVWLMGTKTNALRIEPVYCPEGKTYFLYARQFINKFLNIEKKTHMQDKRVDMVPGDFLLLLELHLGIVNCSNLLQSYRQKGIKIKTVVYDLLPELRPNFFINDILDGFHNWLNLTAQLDGVICISETVKNEYITWVENNQIQVDPHFNIDWFHLGADLLNTNPTKGVNHELTSALSLVSNKLVFIMVGTVEVRKGHLQILNVFEELWLQGYDIALIIAGKEGWKVETFVDSFHGHSEKNKRLFWFNNLSDESLNTLYQKADALIAGSFGEGFGLPLIEAAQHKIPIIARNIPVFREVAGDHAYYFDESTVDEIVTDIKKWIALYKQKLHPQSTLMPYLTWDESAKVLLSKLIEPAQKDM